MLNKLKTRQYWFYFLVITIITSIAIVFFTKKQQVEYAVVFSSDPIIASPYIPRYYCRWAFFPFNVKYENADNNHSPAYKNHLFISFEMLKNEKEYHILNDYELKNCRMIQVRERRIIGYDVFYFIGNQPGKVKVKHDPGETIPLDKQGKLMLAPYL
ncbi:MAG: hypothetical protein LBI71_03900 [Enterobacteriaceae bacterium]|jgi:uncharacterized protein YcfJ|nr:hypothetical protein [Enterobacteriaceae bacterium]